MHAKRSPGLQRLDYFIKLSLLSLLALDEDTGSWPLGQCFIRRNILFNQPHN